MADLPSGLHLHLAWYGYVTCNDPACTRPRADPADDMTCTDPDCEGGCEASRYNSARCGTDAEGHLAYQDGKPLPGLCHCAAGEAHDIEPTASASPEAYGWAALPPTCPVTGWPQIDRDDLDMCACGHRHIKIECWGRRRFRWLTISRRPR